MLLRLNMSLQILETNFKEKINMKTALNIIIAFLIIVIWSDIERNGSKELLNYSNSFFASIGLVIIIILRINHKKFVEFLITAS